MYEGTFYDEELPRGYQDADFLQAAYETEAKEMEALQRRGYCTHGHTTGVPDSGEIYYYVQQFLVGEQRICSDCGYVFDNDDQWVDALHNPQEFQTEARKKAIKKQRNSGDIPGWR